MKIILFGSTGMLGNYVYSILKEKYNVICYTRKEFDIIKSKWIKLKNILNKYQENDIVINCAGSIPHRVKNKNFKEFIKINSLFPHKLNEICNLNKLKLIHISTDCVFNGKKGNYNENDIHDETNIYGLTKSLGEPEDCTIIRTSIIGEEKYNKKSLLEWVKSNKNGEINGYENHLWNGITCLTLAKIIEQIIKKKIFWRGIKHIYSPNTVSKYDLCNYINKIYKLNININKFISPKRIDKSLNSIYDINIFSISNIYVQIEELKYYNIYNE